MDCNEACQNDRNSYAQSPTQTRSLIAIPRARPQNQGMFKFPFQFRVQLRLSSRVVRLRTGMKLGPSSPASLLPSHETLPFPRSSISATPKVQPTSLVHWVTHHCLSLPCFRKMRPNYFRRIRSQSNLLESTNLHEPTSRFNPNPNSKLARTFFGNGRVDFGSGVPVAPPTPPTPSIPLPDLEEPLFNSHWISEKVASDLPSGYTIRPMCRGDYGRGYMDVLRVV